MDVKALLRMSVLYNILTACNRSTGDFLISSPSFNTVYEQELKDYRTYMATTFTMFSLRPPTKTYHR